MPAPRAARTAARKSVVPDPDLYGNPSDSDASDSEQPPSKPPPAKPAGGRRNKGPQPVRGSVTAENGRRRSTRLSTESADSASAPPSKLAKAASRAAKSASKDDEPASPPRAKQGASKGKKRAERERDSAEEDEEDEVVRVGASAKAAPARSGTKRVKKDAVEDVADEGAAQPAASSSAEAAAPRRAFVPRAAANQTARTNKPPPAYSALLVDDSADDPEPFAFSTHPPTPHGPGQAKRAASKTKQNPKGKVPRTARQPQTGSDEVTPDDREPPVPSTSRSRVTPPKRLHSDSAPLHAQETPVQVKNIAFRQGPGTPATGARTARRSSARGSRNRGSSIGGGYEAVPHPQVADDKLYRSTDADDPLAKRLRSIVSWSAQRTRDRVFRSIRDDAMDDAQKAAKDVIDSFISDVCSLRVDTSVPYQEPSQSQDPDKLPPHPQNESNARKMKELEENYAAIAHEQELRQSVEPVYQSFFDRRTEAHATASTSYATLAPPTARDNLGKYAASLDLSRPTPTSLDEALALGRALLAGEGVKPEKPKGAKKGKGKEKAEELDESEALDRQILEAQIETANLRHLTHRLSSFARVASAYIGHRTTETHLALGVQAQRGLLDAAPSAAAREAGSAGAGSGLAAALAGTGAAAAAEGAGEQVQHATGALDPRDLLRAISRADERA
ncbi:hypothetical protein JCM10207_004203 [Rhodosporidiobolus poonsookiae]